MGLEAIMPLLEILLFPGFLFLIALAFFFEWVDRKVFAKLQSRYGPLYTGPSGLLQPLADFLKLPKGRWFESNPRYQRKRRQIQ